MKKVRRWGYDYVKLDFLYAGALPGKRKAGVHREAALRLALQTMRDGLGEAYLATCGVPILPALGLSDAIRIGPDVAEHWRDALQADTLHNFGGPGAQNALRTSLNRLWLRSLVNVDPDVVYFRSLNNGLTPEERQLVQDLARVAGVKATSDPPEWLTAVERAQLQQFLEEEPDIAQIGRYHYRLGTREVDFASHIDLPPDSVFKTTVLKRFLQSRSNSARILGLAERYYWWRMQRQFAKRTAHPARQRKRPPSR
jgi:alpha-galactosidase